ncbi:hypothetical protein AN639_04850 [Candidatus Epulonipiscium fishelsonii]|uniref:Uncharacterized protein n=1 Tax=Candidatus Epulonipiscium fishelsonii TaxID=77094 RepID=A0ACC8XDJ9_9FIRM|nr:hypothetical protein AN639_04850 [Epulopiscium sp. SCG-B05WGA-EpuloA1]ONI40808.1 hypothetical protein AN396_05155 [Epulopiscium sp. SCG-B11WGA-EpuloA1]
MAIELIKKLMDVNETTQKETSQIVKERDLIVPDGKPDMQRVLFLDGTLKMDTFDVQQNRVIYKGEVDITILYLPDNGNEICKMKGSIPIEDFMIIEGVDPEQRVEFVYDIEHLNWNILNERKLNIKVIIEVGAIVTKSKELYLIEDLNTDILVEKKMKELNIVSIAPEKEEKIIVKDELTIPSNKPYIGDILKISTSIKEDQIKRTAEELIFNGMVEVSILYQSMEDNNLNVYSNKIPFSGVVDLIKLDDEQHWDCVLDVSPTFVQVNPDYEGEDRIVEVECIVTAKYTTYNNEKLEIVGDVYAPGKVVNESSKVEKYENLAFKDNISTVTKETLNIDGLNPDIHQVYNIELKAKVDEVDIVNDKLTIEGIIEVLIIYTDEESANKIITFMDSLPFNMDLSTNLNPNNNYNIEAKVTPKDVQLIAVNRESLSIDYKLDYQVNVYETKQISIIDKIEIEDMTKDIISEYPTIIVYTVKNGESLWDIAKKFNTTVKNIAQVNEFDESYQPNSGEKVIIIKQSKF